MLHVNESNIPPFVPQQMNRSKEKSLEILRSLTISQRARRTDRFKSEQKGNSHRPKSRNVRPICPPRKRRERDNLRGNFRRSCLEFRCRRIL